MRRLAFIAALCCATATGAFAQSSNVRAAENIANQDKANFDEARALIGQAMVNPETKNDAKTYFVAGFIEQRQYIGELGKQQQGKPFDQGIMNKTSVKILPYMLKADSLDQLPDANGKVKPRYTKKIVEVLKQAMTWVYNTGVINIQQQQPAESLEAFQQYYKIKNLPMFAADKGVTAMDSSSVRTATIVAQLAISQKKPKEAVDLLTPMLRNPFGQEAMIYQQLSLAYQAMGDNDAFMATLQKGAEACPSDPFFPAALIDAYNAKGDTEMATKYVNDALAKDPNNAQLYIVMGNLYEVKRGNLEEAIKWYKKALEVKPDDATANYEFARAINNKAANITSVSNVTPAMDAEANKLLKDALPMIEKAYQAQPSNGQYLYLLKNYYYRLKMTDKYDQLEAAEKAKK